MHPYRFFKLHRLEAVQARPETQTVYKALKQRLKHHWEVVFRKVKRRPGTPFTMRVRLYLSRLRDSQEYLVMEEAQ